MCNLSDITIIQQPEAVALLKRSIFYAAPVTHLTVPKLKAIDAVRAAFDPNDNPNKPPKQSVAEEQVKTNVIPIHGLRIWDNLVRYNNLSMFSSQFCQPSFFLSRYFGRKTSAKAFDGISAAAEKMGLKDEKTE